MSLMLFDETNLPQNKTGTVTRLTKAEIAAKFIEFKAKFPKRRGGNPVYPAEQKFTKAVIDGENCETIIAAAERFAAECAANPRMRQDPSIIPMMVTWLNQKRWRDDPDAGLVDPQQPKSLLDMARELRERAGDQEPD